MTKQEAIQALDTLVEAYGIALRAIRDSMDAGESAEGVHCDCSHSGPCCNYSDNKGCNHQKENGSCRVPFRNAKLDRSRWEGCEHCKGDLEGYTSCFRNTNGSSIKMYIPEGEAAIVIPGRYNHRAYIKISYCPFCGRPLTEEAWAELERRIGGNDETTD